MTGVRRTLVTVIWIELLASAVLGDGPYRWLYVLLAGGALPVGWILLLTLRSTIPVRELTRVELAIALLMGGFAAGKLVSLAGSPSGMGSIVGGWGGAWMPLALLGLCLQLFVRVWVLNVNGSRARDTNLVSLVLVAAGLFALESAARHTYLEASLDDSDNYSVFAQFDHITRVRVHRDWPDKLFPIAFPARRPDVRQRIVCLGGSSTAGAYQMKELSLFYPFRLQLMLNETPALRTTEVLNQGVGGWNTFLIRKYLESTIDPLAPDLVTLYVGHNDMLTRLPATYRDFWEQYSRGASLERTVQSWLNRSRLYVLYKQMLLARTQYRTRAVPIPDARDNLLAITDLVAARGGRVLLLSEGLSPDPGPLESYFEMMRSFAGSHDGVYYFDAAGSLKNLPQHEVFFDDCHLTPYGHALLAGAILEYLRANPSLLQPADGDTGVPEQEPR